MASAVHVSSAASSPIVVMVGSSPAADTADPGVSLNGRPAPDFTLTDQFGRTRSLHDFRGKVVILAFIDSRCVTVCPFTAVVLQNVEHILRAYRHRFAVVAVNANPVATTVQDIYRWSQQHGMLHRWEYLTGSRRRLEKIYREYYVESQVIQGTDVDHTAAVYVLDQAGRERWVYIMSASSQTGILLTETKELAQHVLDLIPGHPDFRSIAGNGTLTYLPKTSYAPLGSGRRSFTAPAILPDGRPGSVHVGKGTPVLLEFFATWCPDCRQEWPALKAYERAALPVHLPPVVAVDLRVAEPTTRHVADYVRAQGLPFPVVLPDL